MFAPPLANCPIPLLPPAKGCSRTAGRSVTGACQQTKEEERKEGKGEEEEREGQRQNKGQGGGREEDQVLAAEQAKSAEEEFSQEAQQHLYYQVNHMDHVTRLVGNVMINVKTLY